jgi:hypothetical protein
MAEDTLSPLWQTYGEQWTHQLGPDFGLAATESIRYDLSEVRSLQEDKDKAAERMNKGVTAGTVMVSESRATQGLPVDESHEVFLRSASVLEVQAGDTAPVVEDEGEEGDDE